MTETVTWYEEMAAAMRTREKCLNAITRWEVSLENAEAAIRHLASQKEAPDVKTPGPALPLDEPDIY